MSQKPIEHMRSEEIVSEIGSLSRELKQKLGRIQYLSDGLYQRVRRAPPDDNTRIYMRYATSWTRYAGMASQGMRRASAGDRILRGLEAPKPEPAKSIVRPAVKEAPVDTTPVESLLDLYGEGDGRAE